MVVVQGAYNFIRPKEGISTTKDVICGDGYFRSHFSRTHLLLDVCCLANQERDSSLAGKRKEGYDTTRVRKTNRENEG